MKLPVDCDLSETAMIDASNMLGCVPLGDLTLYAPLEERYAARRLQAVHGFELVLVPQEMLASKYTWAIRCDRGVVHSRGVA